VAKQLPEHNVQSVVYPKYDTKGELEEATAGFLEWSVSSTHMSLAIR
jgi:hypothetical protein